jgi:hypothetical protein
LGAISGLFTPAEMPRIDVGAQFSRKSSTPSTPQQFSQCVKRYDGEYKVRNFSCWDQFLTMTFAQVTFRDSLEDTEGCLRSRADQLYRMGFRSTISHRAAVNR